MRMLYLIYVMFLIAFCWPTVNSQVTYDISWNRLNCTSVGIILSCHNPNKRSVVLNQKYNDDTASPLVNHLFLESCRVAGLSSIALRNFVGIKDVFLGNNYVNYLTGDEFRYNQNLDSIDLNSNLLTSISPTTFVKLPKLVSLNLNDNYLDLNDLSINKTLDKLHLGGNSRSIGQTKCDESVHLENMFDLVDVKNLNLSRNCIKSLGANFFRGKKSLRDLDLSNNQLEDLDEDIFIENDGITNLKMGRNRLRTVRSLWMRMLKKLINLDLSHNRIASLPSFKSNINLHTIHLGHNRLSGISDQVFSRNEYLTKVDLSHNAITAISPLVFANLVRMKELRINNNSLTRLSENLFRTVNVLSHLDISDNSIDSIHPRTFENNHNLRYLNFSNNNLEDLRGSLNHIKYLDHLDLHNNLITFVEPELFYFEFMEELVLSCNRLVTLPSLSTKRKRNMNLYISLNPFKCTCLNGIISDMDKSFKLNKVLFLDGEASSCVLDRDSSNCNDNPLKTALINEWLRQTYTKPNKCKYYEIHRKDLEKIVKE